MVLRELWYFVSYSAQGLSWKTSRVAVRTAWQGDARLVMSTQLCHGTSEVRRRETAQRDTRWMELLWLVRSRGVGDAEASPRGCCGCRRRRALGG